MDGEENKIEEQSADVPQTPESFTVEDIIQEFSERGKPPKTQEELDREAFARREMMRFPTVSIEDEEPEKPRLRLLPKRQKKIKIPKPRAYIPLGTVLLRARVRNDAACAKPQAAIMTALCWLVTLAASFLTLTAPNGTFAWSAMAALPKNAAEIASGAAMLVCAAVGWRYLWRGVLAVSSGRVTRETMLALLTAISLLRFGRDTLSCAVSLLLCVTVWSEGLLHAAKTRTQRSMGKMSSPVGIVSREAGGVEALTAAPPDPDALDEMMRTQPETLRKLDRYAFVCAVLSLALSIVAALRFGREFLWAWQIMLLGACPIGGLCGYARSFCRIARRLGGVEAAVGGYVGATILDSSCVALRDDDLFSVRNTRLNGFKMIAPLPAEQVLGYAAALLEATGAGIAPLFAEQCELQGGRHYTPTTVRVYETGGIGGEVQGQIVLLGSDRFLRSMNVTVGQQYRKSGALYIAVGGEAAAVVMVQYQAEDAVRGSLAALASFRRQRLVLATRDVLLTPDAVGAQFHISPDRLEYPLSGDRAALSEQADGGACAAMLGGWRFVRFAQTCVGAKQICAGARLGKRCAAAGCVMGMAILALLALMGARSTASGANILLYHALWLLPVLIGTSAAVQGG